MKMWPRCYFGILPEHINYDDHENMAWNFISSKRSKQVSDINGNGGKDLWHIVGFISEELNSDMLWPYDVSELLSETYSCEHIFLTCILRSSKRLYIKYHKFIIKSKSTQWANMQRVCIWGACEIWWQRLTHNSGHYFQSTSLPFFKLLESMVLFSDEANHTWS